MMKIENFSQNSDKKEGENIIQALGLVVGKELFLRKKSLHEKSAVKVGQILEGKLKHNVQIGLPIEFENGGTTSYVQNIKEENGGYLITTATSIYEIIGEQPDAEKITDFESFTTAQGSVYTVLENGQVSRYKTAQLNKDYIGEDKYESVEKKPADIMLFYKPTQKFIDWFAVGALDPGSEKKIAQTIDIGVYKKIDEDSYQLVTNNKELDSSFLFIRVKKNDIFKLKDSFTTQELGDFQKRTFDPKNKGLGLIISSETGNISHIPTLGYKTFDYRYTNDGRIESMHNGNSVVSVKKRA